MLGPKVFVVILNWNHKAELLETIESFKAQDYQYLKIIISDNGSTDDSIKTVKETYKDIKCVENNQNLGWAAGNNAGIKYALNNSAELILLANNDISLESFKVVKQLVSSYEYLDRRYKVGILGAKENFYDHKGKTRSVGWDEYVKAQKSGKVYNKFKNQIEVCDKRYKLVDGVSGSFMLINSKLFTKIGLMDENYFMYAEETDFCLRAWALGYISVIDTEVIVYHKVASSSGTNSPFFYYYKTRNNHYLLKKNKDLIQDYKYFLTKYYIGVFKEIIKIILNIRGSKKMRKILSICLGLFHSTVLKKYGYTFK